MAEVQTIPAPNIEFYYVLSGLFGVALITIIVGIFNHFKSQMKEFSTTNVMVVERLEELSLNQALQKKDLEQVAKDTAKNTDHIDRLNRLQREDTQELAELIISKLRAATP